MLHSASRRASETVGSSSTMTAPEARSGSKPMAISHRRTASSRPKVTFKSQTWAASSSRPWNTTRSTTRSTNKRASSDRADSTPATKSQSRFASLFISLLAVSPAGIEYEAADQETMQAAQKAATQSTAPKKTHRKSLDGVRLSEIRKMRWKRFKYELGLKMKSARMSSGKRRGRMEDVELEQLRGEGS